MRLIDADALHFKCNSSRYIQAIYGPGFYAAEFAIDEAPTIDPNDLPVVKELREKLERVTAERDAAVRDLYIAKDCNTCALRFTDDCLLEECMDPCNSFAYGNVPYKWRGAKKKVNSNANR